MKKVREYIERVYDVLAYLLAELPTEINPVPLAGLIVMLLWIPLLLKLLGM